MTPEVYVQAGRLFDQLRQLPENERAEAVDAACGSDAELRVQVMRLFSADSDASEDSFLKNQAMEDATQSPDVVPAKLPAPGTVIGNYRLGSRIGAGGMGIVYEAEDLHLNRKVAIKILALPRAVESAERIKRFQREAHAIALLNHPNILSIFDAGFHQGHYYIATEFVDGKTLGQLAAEGPVERSVLLDIGMQICSALAAAHQAGMIHRDVKPDNAILRPDGILKLLDFGLAKLLEPEKRPSADVHTRRGIIAGTPRYLSPEQVLGHPVGPQCDIFSTGALLYHLATGKRPFDGATDGAILAAVVSTTPPPPSKLRPAVDDDFDAVIMRAIEKDPELRFQTAADLRSSLKRLSRDSYSGLVGRHVEARSAPSTISVAGTPDKPRPPVSKEPAPDKLPWVLAAMLALGLAVTGVMLWRATRPVEHPLTRLSLDLWPEAAAGLNTSVAISPDGRRVVYPVKRPDGKQQLATRLLDQAAYTLLPGTVGGFDAFFSPDGQWIGFFANGQLMKISVQGGAPVALCEAGNPRGASWGDDGNIVVALTHLSPLSRIPAAGGTPRNLTNLSAGENTHRWPQVLPGGRAVLFTASSTNVGQENANIEVVSLETGQIKVLHRGGYFGRFLPGGNFPGGSFPGGYLLYVHQGVVFAVAFDAKRLEVRGTPTPMIPDIAANPLDGGGQFDVSGTASGPGTLVYLAGKGAAQSLGISWLDGHGKMQPLISAPGAYSNPRFSPDGRKLAYQSGEDIFIYDLQRAAAAATTFGGNSTTPVWAPDGQHIVFRAGSALSWIRSDGAGEPQRLLEGKNARVPWSFSPDGKHLAYFEIAPETGRDLWTLTLDTTDPDQPKAAQPEVFLRTPANELFPTFSPDGKWIAYRSDESGTPEIYVRPFPAASAGKWRISTGGAWFAFWSNHGHELFYTTADNRIMVLDYLVHGDSFEPGKPRVWSGNEIFNPGLSTLDLDPDGTRFAVINLPETTSHGNTSVHAVILENFIDELQRRVPLAK